MKYRRARKEEILILRSIADYQFGWPAGDLLIPDNAILGISPATMRIREIRGEEGLLAVLRAHDYMFSLSISGARRLLRLDEPRLRAWINPVSSLQTKNIDCSHVDRIDRTLLPGEEVIVLTSDNRLIGVGRLKLSPLEIEENSCKGEAIRIRRWAERYES